MLSSHVLRRAHNATCAIGFLPVPLREWVPQQHPLRVEGSGFLVRENTVITNSHVVDTVAAQAREFGVSQAEHFLAFVAPSRLPARIGTVRMIRRTHTPEGGGIDIALIEIKPEPPSQFKDIEPLPIAATPEVIVSEEVFVCGYPYTNLLLDPEGSPHRLGPVVQQGFVSGLAPFAGAHAPEEILLDVRTAGGMSGSPVVRSSTGEVIGVNYEAITRTAQVTTTSFAIPLHRLRLTSWLQEFDIALRDA